jgi:hypothetical protein
MFVKHKRTEKTYEVISVGKMKNPQTGDWIPAVFYMPTSWNEGDPRVYARQQSDFDEKFEVLDR